MALLIFGPSTSVGSSTFAGYTKLITFGLLNVEVNTKKVSNKKAKSTMGVISTRVDPFFARFLPLEWPPPPPSAISAILI
jgi:hypothetical protein